MYKVVVILFVRYDDVVNASEQKVYGVLVCGYKIHVQFLLF